MELAQETELGFLEHRLKRRGDVLIVGRTAGCIGVAGAVGAAAEVDDIARWYKAIPTRVARRTEGVDEAWREHRSKLGCACIPGHRHTMGVVDEPIKIQLEGAVALRPH